MKKALLIFVIGLFSINVFAQSDTIAINQENRNTTIVIPQLGTTKISVVLDILLPKLLNSCIYKLNLGCNKL